MLKFKNLKEMNVEIEKGLKEKEPEENKKKPEVRASPKEVVDAFNYGLSEGMRKIISATRFRKEKRPEYFTLPLHKCGLCAKNLLDELWSVMREPFKDSTVQVPFETVYCIECIRERVENYRRFKERDGAEVKGEESGRVGKTAQSTDLLC